MLSLAREGWEEDYSLSIDANRFSRGCEKIWGRGGESCIRGAGAERKDKKSKWDREERGTKRDRDALSGHSIICRAELPPLSLLSAGRLFGSLSGDAIGAYLARQVATPWHPHIHAHAYTLDATHRCASPEFGALYSACATNGEWCVRADKTDSFHSSCCHVYIT